MIGIIIMRNKRRQSSLEAEIKVSEEVDRVCRDDRRENDEWMDI